jgi:hypothetical protein
MEFNFVIFLSETLKYERKPPCLPTHWLLIQYISLVTPKACRRSSPCKQGSSCMPLLLANDSDVIGRAEIYSAHVSSTPKLPRHRQGIHKLEVLSLQMKMVALSTFVEILKRISDRRLLAPPGSCRHCSRNNYF